MKLIMENWRRHLSESDSEMIFNISAKDKLTDKGISGAFDRFLRTKHFDAWNTLDKDGEGFLDKPITGLLRKYWIFAKKFQKKDGRFVPPETWLEDIQKGAGSYYRQWNNEN
jgi:hypothetical protein